jgi:hypothetical protein
LYVAARAAAVVVEQGGDGVSAATEYLKKSKLCGYGTGPCRAAADVVMKFPDGEVFKVCKEHAPLMQKSGAAKVTRREAVA